VPLESCLREGPSPDRHESTQENDSFHQQHCLFGSVLVPALVRDEWPIRETTRASFAFQQAGCRAGRMLFRRMCNGTGVLLSRCAQLAQLGRNTVNDCRRYNGPIFAIQDSQRRNFSQYRKCQNQTLIQRTGCPWLAYQHVSAGPVRDVRAIRTADFH